MENYIIANQTDTGRVRSVNEDSMATFDSPNGRVVVVCDGMGGQNAGDVASQLAVAVIQDILTDNRFNSPEEAISKSIIAANQAILVRSAQDMSLSGMGSTCVMLIISEGKVYYGSVGDSRIYYIADGTIRQLTKDQSYVQTLVDAGELTQEAAEHHQDKNQITNALGIEGMTPPVVCQVPIIPEPGSIFLLCSDGLSGMVNGSIINQVLSSNSLTLQDKAKELIRLANEAGGLDNITVQLIEFPRSGVCQNPHGTPIATGNNASAKPSKNRAILFWSAAIFCLILVIGGVTYWMIHKDEPRPKATTTTKTEVKEKNTKTIKSTNSPSQPAASTKTEEQSKVIVIEKEVEKSAKAKKSNKTDKATDKVKEIKEKVTEEAESSNNIEEKIRTTDLSGDK